MLAQSKTRSRRSATIAERVARYSGIPGPIGCMEWTARTDPDGYGEIRVDGKLWRAHRLAWTAANGPIPTGLQVLHHCDNPPCVNVQHLFLGTNKDNHADKKRKGRTIGRHTKADDVPCPRGHVGNFRRRLKTHRKTGVIAPGRTCKTCEKMYAGGKWPKP